MSEKRIGTLIYDPSMGRFDIRFGIESYYGGLHCGECFDVKVKDAWIPVRIEMDEDGYLVGLPKTSLSGLTVRMYEEHMMEAKKKYEKPAFRLVTDLGSILECLYEVYGTDGTMLIAGNKLSDTVIYPFIRMIKKKCKAVDAEKLNLMLWKIYMVSSRKKEFVTAAKKELQPYLTKKDEKQIDTTYDTTYTIDRRH